MKKNNWLFLMLILSVGCSRSKDYPTIFSKIHNNDSQSKVVQRYLATAGEDLCFKDSFNIDLLKAQVKEFENKYPSDHKISGQWKHLNYADLPVAQALFLKKFGHRIGDLKNPDLFDYSSCQDVPCLFNKIYQKENHVAGYVHYLWYLKTGILLSATNVVYESKFEAYVGQVDISKIGIYNKKKFPVSAYLYNDGELFSFWRLLQMMKAPYTNLTDLKEIHKIPRGEQFEDVQAEIDLALANKKPVPLSRTCGIADSGGYIVYQDACLTIDLNWESENFNPMVLHELTHHLDYHEGKKRKVFYRSQEADYVAVSGFYIKEYKDAQGTTVRQWAHKENAKFVRDYAGKTVVENFADTIAYYRAVGTHTKEIISKEQYKFISDNYFESKEFDRESQIQNWLFQKEGEFSQAAYKAVMDCSNSNVVTAGNFFSPKDFSVAVMPKMLKCLSNKALDISLDVRLKLKTTEPDGCRFLLSYNLDRDWNPGFKKALASHMSKYLIELQKDKTFFDKVKPFLDDIGNRTLANENYLRCLDPQNEKECYNSNVMASTLVQLQEFSLPENYANDLAEMYLENHSFEDTKEYISSYYKNFIASRQDSIETEAGDLFSRCTSETISDKAAPKGKSFSIRSGYMVSSIYNCLNNNFADSVKSVVRNLAVGEMRVQHPKEEVIFIDEVKPKLQDSLEVIFLKNKEEESKILATYLKNDQGSLSKKMRNDFSWAKNVLSKESITQDCLNGGLKGVDLELRYHSKADAFRDLITGSCAGIDESPEFTLWLDQAKTSFSQNSLQLFKDAVLKLAHAKARSCVQTYPVDSALNKVKFKTQRDSCLLDAWPEIEKKAMVQVENDPLTMKLKIDLATLKPQIDSSRRGLQIKVIKENF